MSAAPVHILTFVRKPELLRAALLSFRTLRVGFPHAPLKVWGNALDHASEQAVRAATRHCGGQFINTAPTSHDGWIEELIQRSQEPFWVADTDLLFWDSMEQFDFGDDALAGRLEPAFLEEFTGTFHAERLHASLLYINPALTRAAMRAWMARIPQPFNRSAEFPFVRQHFIPRRDDKPLFYDTCAGLWQAGIGSPFNEGMDDCFDHLHCSTYVDLIAPKLSVNLAEAHAAIYDDPARGKGMRHAQAEYYARRSPDHAIHEQQ